MGQPHDRSQVRSACPGWQVFIIGFAICGLTVSLATRTFRLKVPHGVSVISGGAQAMRQHMNRDADRWVPPVPLFTPLQVPTFYPYVAPAGPPLASVLFEEKLYNRPPPSC
ncbi:MAG TPA: hypothetical protein VEI52_22535 [Terriglobales bacterium]|nr:hypothetical protein [Terriglobales bacterium]